MGKIPEQLEFWDKAKMKIYYDGKVKSYIQKIIWYKILPNNNSK